MLAFLTLLPLLSALLVSPSSTAARAHQGRRASPSGLEDATSTVESRSITPRDLDINAAVGICVKLNAAARISSAVSLGAGACVCVDAATNADVHPGGLSLNAGVEVYASGGAHFTGQVASDIALTILEKQLLPLLPAPYAFAFAKANTCLQVNALISNSYHNFQPNIAGGCCARACNPGYTLRNGRCQPGCEAGQILCGDQCYNSAQYTCPSGVAVKNVNKRQLRGRECPMGMRACALSGREWGYECVDWMTDIESCGGCVDPSRPAQFTDGTDCTGLPNIDEVTCSRGTCAIQACARGFVLSSNGTSCEPRPSFKHGTAQLGVGSFEIMS